MWQLGLLTFSMLVTQQAPGRTKASSEEISEEMNGLRDCEGQRTGPFFWPSWAAGTHGAKVTCSRAPKKPVSGLVIEETLVGSFLARWPTAHISSLCSNKLHTSSSNLEGLANLSRAPLKWNVVKATKLLRECVPKTIKGFQAGLEEESTLSSH